MSHHPATPPAGDALWQEAIEAVIRAKALPHPADTEREARRWCARSPAHAAAWAEAERVWRVAGALPPSPGAAPRGRPARRPGRRAVLAGAGALAAGAGGLLLAPPVLHGLRGDTVTGTAELRDLTLGDGSRVTLGPDSVVRIARDGGGGRLDMLDGMAYVEARTDPDRPLTAGAGRLRVQTADAAFELRHQDGAASVSMIRGHALAEIAAGTDAAAAAAPPSLGPGDWLAAGEGGVRQGRTVPDQVAAWRDGMLMVDRRPIAAVAGELERWYAGRILVLDADFGRRPVSGVFDLRQPEAALRAAVQPYGGRVRRLAGWLLLVDAG
ncbi:FecR family protein [Azospirillum sp. ST 5-10]|uniref:FecR family protein n=1 Tax=unclassified Azospirillum TaxID=2630922 RepID=UPI003F49D47E